MTLVKICGITRMEDAESACALGAGALGFNFYAKSKRQVSPETARVIVERVPKGIWRVGVFVNHTRSEIEAIVAVTGIDTLQLHGDESPELAGGWPGLRVIKALRIGTGAPAVRTNEFLAHAAYLLLDRYDANEYGGTGETIPDHALAPFVEQQLMNRVLLAGGLTPGNTAERVAKYRPFGVDTASGVESSPGIKDAAKMKAFIAAAQQGA